MPFKTNQSDQTSSLGKLLSDWLLMISPSNIRSIYSFVKQYAIYSVVTLYKWINQIASLCWVFYVV